MQQASYVNNIWQGCRQHPYTIDQGINMSAKGSFDLFPDQMTRYMISIIIIQASLLRCLRLQFRSSKYNYRLLDILIVFANCLHIYDSNKSSKLSAADEESFALVGHCIDLVIQLRLLVLQDRNGDHVPGGPAGSSQRFLRLHKHIWHILTNHNRTFSSQSMGKCRTISSGVASAAMMMSSVMPRFKVLVDSLAPFLICLREAHCETRSKISEESYSVARGWARSGMS